MSDTELRPAPPVWPVVLGILAMAFGGLGIVGYGCIGVTFTLLLPLFGKAMEEQAALQVQAAQFEALGAHVPLALASNAGSAAFAVLLLVAGAKLMRRRPGSGRLILIWAVGKILWAIPAAIFGYVLNRAQFEAMADAAREAGTNAPAAMPSGFYGMMQSLGIVGVVIGLAWAWALPVFMIVWFTRPRIKAEVSSWA